MEKTQQDFFHFAGRVPRLLIDGLSIASTKDLVLFLVGLAATAFILESLQRVSRECLRRVPKPARQASAGADGLLKRTRSDKVPLTSYTTDETESPQEVPETDGTNGDIPAENGVGSRQGMETRCCPGECDLKTDAGVERETASLVDQTSCCRDTAEMTEGEKRARTERMWKSLSLEVLGDRWEILQTTCEEREGRPKRITHSKRVVYHFLQAVLSMGQLSLGYVLMLVVMTYNAWFLVCVVGGAGLGYLVFSSDLERAYADYAECYVRRKADEEDARRRSCASRESCGKPSRKKTQWSLKRETSC